MELINKNNKYHNKINNLNSKSSHVLAYNIKYEAAVKLSWSTGMQFT